MTTPSQARKRLRCFQPRRLLAGCILVCLLWVALAGVGLNTYFAYYQGHALWLMPYEWYDLPMAVARLYYHNTGISLSPLSDSEEWRYATHNNTQLPKEKIVPHVDWDQECPSRRRPPLPSIDQLMARVQQLRAREKGVRSQTQKDPGPKIIHVLSNGGIDWFVWRQVLESPDPAAFNSSLACPTDSLGPNESSNAPWHNERKCIFFPEFNIEFRLILRQVLAEELPLIRNLLILDGLYWQNMAPLNDPGKWHEDLAIGAIFGTEENCLNGYRQLSDIHPRLRFAFITYGDCHLVDNVNTFIWPLGVTLGDGFPQNFHPEYNPPVTSRSLLLNLIASFTPRKPTRIQAYLAAAEECEARPGVECVLSAQGLSDSFMDQLDAVMSVSRSPSIAVALDGLLNTPTWTACSSEEQAYCSSSRYIRSLRSSIFTLCPQGNNPESYRAWEAIMSGSIPIVDDWPTRMRLHPLSFYHPGYETTFACGWDDDVWFWLKATDAPVLWIKDDWKRELHEILDRFRIGSNATDWVRLTDHQTRLKQWFNSLKRHLRLLLIHQVLTHMT